MTETSFSIDREEAPALSDRQLSEAVLAGDETAGLVLHEKYHRLIAHIARKAIPRLRNGSVDEDDLVQAGWEHALTRLRHFSSGEDKPYSLKTSITGYLFEAVNSGIVDKQYAVRLPEDVSQILNRIQAINTERMNANRPMMSEEEISEEFGLEYGDLDGSRKTTGVIMRATRLTKLMGSTDKGFNPGADFSFGDGYVLDEINAMTMINGEPDVEVEMQAEKEAMRAYVKEVVRCAPLTDQQRRALELRFGLGSEDGQEMLLEEVGRELGVSGGRASQLVLRALEKLQEHRPTFHALKDYTQAKRT